MTSKWNLGDIVPADRERRPARRSVETHRAEPRAARPAPPEGSPRTRGRRGGKKRWILALIILLIAGAAGAAFALLFGGANVVVHPKTRSVNIDATITAYQEAAPGELAYETLELVAEDQALVSATGQEEVEEQASGSITIYNEFSQNPQRLITNTRFESEGGLIFRMTESVDVPGYTRNPDGTLRPGTITATIYASETGERYNIAPGRLTIPGLGEGTEQFQKMYGVLAEPMTGGFAGLKYIVPEGELAAARSALAERLRAALLARLATERPNGFILFEPAITFSYATLSTTDAGNRQVALREQGKLQVPVFPAEEFASYIAERTLAGYEGESIRIENPAALRFSYAGDAANPLAGDTIQFALSGTARIVWNYDAEQLRRDLRGVSKNGIQVVTAGYPAISEMSAVVKPFWKTHFPDELEKITITERLD